MSKTRKVSFSSVYKRKWLTSEDSVFSEIDEVITFVKKLSKKERQFEMKEDKFCLLQTATTKKDNDGHAIISGLFKSARHTFRPNLIDKETGEERLSPKRLSEGDVEKTHFAFKLTPAELFLVVEINGHGLTVNQIIEYINAFTKKHLNAQGKRKGFSVKLLKLGRKDFLAQIQSMKRIKTARIFFDKKLLGSNCLNFSNRTTNLQRDLELTVKAQQREDISETAIDFWNSFSSKKNDSISKVRIEGRDENDTEVALDTSFMEMVDSIDVSVNGVTGEVESKEMLRALQAFTKNL
ncbi:hypothetical protein EV200_103428 [Pedobacter psychrotolerans]|uniref:Uncharacterized protein n=1 Tax=Pedobacter psychrotolerans TaxID=1843235 RepID=A0A4R2HGC9_9SPHI|nr:hypothetical protein [Pedobacter psychrotolerans]TCO27094.1 hypothetical protein EV200_103428 [Pedobacter psychrotolerans]GGE58836.1 hypothetical protein GCM10011413_26670 [Pedobacter psychrotolerans]